MTGSSTTSSDSVVSNAPLSVSTAPPVPTVAATVTESTENVNLPEKNPNTSIVAVPANASNSPSRSIVWLPTTGAVPNAAAQSSATAFVIVPSVARPPFESWNPDALL